MEAHKVKIKADLYQKAEEDKFNFEKNQKIKHKVEKLTRKQMLEKNALKEKLNIEYEMLKKEKESDLERLIHKYKNRRLELEIQQKQEKILTENDNLMKASKKILNLF